MSRLIEQDGKAYRVRRGRLVEIPVEWVGQTLHPQTKRKRPSKLPRKQRMHRSATGWAYQYGRSTGVGHPRGAAPRHLGAKAEREDER